MSTIVCDVGLEGVSFGRSEVLVVRRDVAEDGTVDLADDLSDLQAED